MSGVDETNLLRSDAATDVRAAAHADVARLFERHRLDVYRYVRSWGVRQEEAADLTATVFERALRALDRGGRADTMSRAWLIAVARNLAIDAARRRDAARRGLRFWPRPELAPDPADLLIRDEEDRQLADRIARLPGGQRDALVMRYAGGLSAREIGEVLGRSEAAAHKLVNRALQALKEAYRGE